MKLTNQNSFYGVAEVFETSNKEASIQGEELPASRSVYPPIESLRAFDAVARIGSIRKAAQWLDRDHAIISRHLNTLEKWVSVKLIERTRSGVVLTDLGKSYHEKVAIALKYIAQATHQLSQSDKNKKLVIWCVPGFAFYWLSNRLEEFNQSDTGITVVLRPTDQGPNFSSSEADLDIRLTTTPATSQLASPEIACMEIARMPMISVASPDYLSGAATISHPKDLLSHQLIHEDAPDKWINWFLFKGIEISGELPGHFLWHGLMTLDASLQGRGVALTNRLIASKDLASGRLVEIGKDDASFPIRLASYTLFARMDKWDDINVVKFRKWIAKAILEDFPDLAPHDLDAASTSMSA